MARRPYTGRTTSPYGRRLATIPGASTMHYGVDGVGGYNTAPERGRIAAYGYIGGWGNRISFQGDSGTLHYLAHNAPGGLLLPVGTRAAEGVALGIKGMTGTATGIHVHWETRPGGGNPIDPEAWLRSQGGTAGGGGTPIDEDESENQMHPYFNVKTKELAVGGPGVWEVIPPAPVPGGNGLQIVRAAFGTEIPMQDPDYGYIRSICLAGKSTATVDEVALAQAVAKLLPAADAGALATALAKLLSIPTADQNGAAARAAIIKP